MALVSFDQVAFIKEDPLSLTYWTFISAYVAHGNEHAVQTFFGTAHGKAALVNSPDALCVSREVGFHGAMENMIVNLDTELTHFEERVRNGAADVKVTRSGGGSFSLIELMLFASALGSYRRISEGR